MDGVVRFLSGEQCRALTKKLGVDCRGPVSGDRVARHLKVFDAFYTSRVANGPEVAEALVEYQGAFTECLVWACDLPWGDRSQEDEPRSDWKVFRDWRRRQGEWRNLYDAPGHLFEGRECAALAKLIEWALDMGWDALIAAAPSKGAVLLSHDDYIRICSRGTPDALLRRLERLGLRTTRWCSAEV
jgi:hypothetical protein